jgi:hypothetical protein
MNPFLAAPVADYSANFIADVSSHMRKMASIEEDNDGECEETGEDHEHVVKFDNGVPQMLELLVFRPGIIT